MRHIVLVFLCLSIAMMPFMALAEKPAKPSANKTAIKASTAKPNEETLRQEWGKEIKQAEDYLAALKTGQARFVQTTHDGTQLVGTFYIERPGKLRFQYDPPIEDFVVADGFFIYFYDAELKEQTNAPIGQTLADFFLRQDIAFSGDLAIQNIKRGGDLLQITLAQASDPAAGSLTLGFAEEPFALKKWRIVDAQGLITEVELFYLKTGMTHPSRLFVYADPASVAGGGVKKYNN
jgi:outer membrane lipoprotein-sorting protein